MQPTSLGYRTDLIFHRFEGEVIDRGRYLVIRTPSNPNYYWGNFLLFSAPPQPGDFRRWNALFEKEIGVPPCINHKVLAWDTVDGDNGVVEDFLAAGFELSEEVVMTASQLIRPHYYNHDLELRGLTTDADFTEHLELHVLCCEDGGAGYRAFHQAKTDAY